MKTDDWTKQPPGSIRLEENFRFIKADDLAPHPESIYMGDNSYFSNAHEKVFAMDIDNPITRKAIELAAAFSDHCLTYNITPGTKYHGVVFGGSSYEEAVELGRKMERKAIRDKLGLGD